MNSAVRVGLTKTRATSWLRSMTAGVLVSSLHVMRGRRFNDLRAWNLDPQTKAELRAKGVIKNYGTGSILLTAAQALDEILLVPDEEVGKMPEREKLKTEAIEQKTRFKTGWLVWSELGQGVTRPDILAKIRILG